MARSFSCILARLFFLLSTLVLVLSFATLQATTYGSNLAPSRPSRIFIPNTDTTANFLGFASLDSGFFLEDYTTKCTYNALFSIAGNVGLTGGSLYLWQDLTLGNTLNFVTAGGLIDGGTHALELPCTNQDFSIPSIGAMGDFAPLQIANPAMTADVYCLDWSYNGQYLFVGTNTSASTELQLYYFDGTTITTTDMTPTSGEVGRAVNSIAWFPNDNYVAITIADGAGDDLLVYYKRTNGSFSFRTSVPLTSGGQAIAWHPSGSFIAVGTDAGNQVRTYQFNQTTGTFGSLLSSIALTTISRNALRFAPGGNFLVLGNASGSGNTLNVLSVTGGGTIATSVGVNPGATVQAVDWCPTGTYIAIGLPATTDSLRVYAHSVSGGTLTEVTTARVGESKSVNNVCWDPTGTFLAVAMTTGTAPQLRIFYFDKTNLRLIEVYRKSSVLNTVYIGRWNRTGTLFTYGLATSFNVTTLAIQQPPLTLADVNLVLNSNTNLYLPIKVKGNCKINGRNKRLALQAGSSILVSPGSSLIFEDVELAGLGKTNLGCMMDSAAITFCNCQLDLAHNYSFTTGSLLFDETVAITGTNAFILSSSQTCTINSQATLYVGPGATLQYAPIVARSDRLYFTDPTSMLYLNNCSLVSSSTALQLQGGTLIFDDNVTLSSQALYPANGMSLNTTMTIKVRAGANVQMYGIIRAD